jgi:hypothetical protein
MSHKAKPDSRYGITKMAILDLRSKGYSYNRIQKELNCSKGTISYHLGTGQKAKTLERSRKFKRSKKSADAVLGMKEVFSDKIKHEINLPIVKPMNPT